MILAKKGRLKLLETKPKLESNHQNSGHQNTSGPNLQREVLGIGMALLVSPIKFCGGPSKEYKMHRLSKESLYICTESGGMSFGDLHLFNGNTRDQASDFSTIKMHHVYLLVVRNLG